jgi:hypothetical protein
MACALESLKRITKKLVRIADVSAKIYIFYKGYKLEGRGFETQ